MSTSWSMTCVDHDDVLPGDEWDGVALSGATRLSQMWLERGRIAAIHELMRGSDRVDVTVEVFGYVQIGYSMREWISRHRDCHVQLINEYGDRHDAESLTVVAPHHCGTCTCPPGRGRNTTDEQWALRAAGWSCDEANRMHLRGVR